MSSLEASRRRRNALLLFFLMATLAKGFPSGTVLRAEPRTESWIRLSRDPAGGKTPVSTAKSLLLGSEGGKRTRGSRKIYAAMRRLASARTSAEARTSEEVPVPSVRRAIRDTVATMIERQESRRELSRGESPRELSLREADAEKTARAWGLKE